MGWDREIQISRPLYLAFPAPTPFVLSSALKSFFDCEILSIPHPLPLKFLPLPFLLELPLSHPFVTSRTPFSHELPLPCPPPTSYLTSLRITWIPVVFFNHSLFTSSKILHLNMLFVEIVSSITFDVVLCSAVSTNIGNLFIKANEKHEYVTRFSFSGSFYINTSRLNQN